MKFFHPISAPENLHCHKTMNSRRSVSFLLWLPVAATLFIFFILYSPHPFKISPKQNVVQTSLSVEHKKDDDKCDLFMGHWIPELRGSVYTNWSCSTIPDSKNCGKNGRKDVDFVNWRWKPVGCELPRFDAKAFMRIVQGKTLAFIGDSVARNQMESLLCLLSQEGPPTNMYKDPEDRCRTWYYPSHNFTLMVLWTKFLVIGEEKVINGSSTGVYNLYLDQIDVRWAEKLPKVDYAVVSDTHWFFRKLYLYENGSLLGCVFCNEANLTDLGLGFAVQRVFRNALTYMSSCKECRGLVTLLRTFSPAHFENGTWNTGGNCNRTSPLSEGELRLDSTDWDLRSIQVEEIERARKEGEKMGEKFGVLDVTRAMLLRPDGHPGSHWNSKGMEGFNDCVHWCLPGPIDTWNDLLMEMLRRLEANSPLR